MEITEVRIKLMEESGERLMAFCSITFDHAFVIRDLKIIGGANGPFVAMPSRRLTFHCRDCGAKNHLKAAYCNQCGARQRHDPAREEDGRTKLYADIAHPINQACRDQIQQKVIEAFHLEQERAKQPGYVSSYDDFDEEASPPPRRQAPRREVERREIERREPERREAEPTDTRRRDERHETVVRKAPPLAPPASPPPAAAPSVPSTVETKKVEPPVNEPRPPHTPVSAPAQREAPAEQKKSKFGEGIL